MVKIVVLSEYISNPPEPPLGRAKILEGKPLYELTRVKKLASDEQQLMLWTRKCRQDIHKLFDNDLERVCKLIQALQKDDYIDSEWCENGGGAWAACDAYCVRRREHAPFTGKPVTIEYFVKFAVSGTGQLLLLVSCHL